jgi:hypothetical protein
MALGGALASIARKALEEPQMLPERSYDEEYREKVVAGKEGRHFDI